MRASLPRMASRGAYSLVVGTSASFPVPGSGLVSMEQAALLMMQQVLQVEAAGRQRVFALVLGPVGTRSVEAGDPGWVSADQVGAVAVAASAASAVDGRQFQLGNRVEADQALAFLRAAPPLHAQAMEQGR